MLDPSVVAAADPAMAAATRAICTGVATAWPCPNAALAERLQFACLFISHDLAVVDMVAHRVGVLHHGLLVEQGPGFRVMTHPRDPYTRRLLASLPVPDPAEQARRRRALRAG